MTSTTVEPRRAGTGSVAATGRRRRGAARGRPDVDRRRVMPAPPRSRATAGGSASVRRAFGPAAALASAASVAALDDLVGDHRGEQERALQDQADLLRDADRRRARCVARSIVAHTSAAAAMPTGWLRPSSASGEAGEAERFGNWSPYCRSRVGQQRRQADHAGDGARHEHRDQHHPLRVDAGGAGGGRVGARHAQVEAEPAAVEQQRSSRRRGGSRTAGSRCSDDAVGEVEADGLEQPVERGMWADLGSGLVGAPGCR